MSELTDLTAAVNTLNLTLQNRNFEPGTSSSGGRTGGGSSAPSTDLGSIIETAAKAKGLSAGQTDMLKQAAQGVKGFAEFTLTKAFGISSDVVNIMAAFGKYGKQFYDSYQSQYGGIQDIRNISNETSKAQVAALDTLTGVFYDNQAEFGDAIAALQVTTATANKAEVNAAFAYMESAAELQRDLGEVTNSLAETQMLRMNKLSNVDKTRLGMMEKGFNVSSQMISDVLERQIATTGEASIDIFTKVSSFSDAVAGKTGIAYKQIAKTTMELISDVERFGNVQVDEAARIAGALGQLGLSYRSFGSMVDKFMNFDSAAQSLGNLTTVFGIHFDAMEMMMLANEDQEEFLYRMREAFLDAGKSIDDMTLAEKKLASQQMGMSVTDLENFMRDEREISDTRAETADASKKTMSEGFETMTQNMVLVERSLQDMEKHMQRKFFHPLRKEAYETGETMVELQDLLIKEFPDNLKVLQAEVQGLVKGGLLGPLAVRESFKESFLAQVTQRTDIFGEDDIAIVTEFTDKFEGTLWNIVTKVMTKVQDPAKFEEVLRNTAMRAANISRKANSAVEKARIRGVKLDYEQLFKGMSEDKHGKVSIGTSEDFEERNGKRYDMTVERVEQTDIASKIQKLQTALNSDTNSELKNEIKALIAALVAMQATPEDRRPITLQVVTPDGTEISKASKLINLSTGVHFVGSTQK